MEEKKQNIYEKLSNIQNELKAPKGQRNSFGNYNYRSCEDILEAVKPICKNHRTALVLTDELVVVGDNNPIIVNEKTYDRNNKEIKNDEKVSSMQRYYIKATATLYDLDSDKSISNTAYAREEETKKGMDGSQITGTASSYARKYALNGLFNIDDTKDADTDEFTKQTKKEDKAPSNFEPSITKGQLEMLSKFSLEVQAKIIEHYKVVSLDKLTLSQASEFISKNKKDNK